jgi:DNA-binding IclR family transcriptional regulator
LLPLRLTHETLAGLSGAQRPSVTTALRTLERDGALRRDEQGGWLLLGDPPGDAERAVGEHDRIRPAAEAARASR